jgi:hypothetical protein
MSPEIFFIIFTSDKILIEIYVKILNKLYNIDISVLIQDHKQNQINDLNNVSFNNYH